jgi:hypothetical protein
MARQRQRETSTYTVSVLEHVTLVSEWQDLDDESPRVPVTAEADLWRDAGTVEVPAGSREETIIRTAEKDGLISPATAGPVDGRLSLRLLDERSGRVRVVEYEPQAPKLKIGTA